MRINPLTAIDFYKAGHKDQYPEGTELVYSNITPRSNRLSNLPDNNEHMVFFGLQFFIKDFLINSFNDNFFNLDKKAVVAAYKRRMDNALGPDAIDVSHIEELHDLGYLPLQIRALKEGTKVPMGVPMVTLYNTHPNFFWLVNYIESVLSAYIWRPCTSATTANWYRVVLERMANLTGASKDFVPFQAHDFSFRGMSGVQDAAISGAAHLTSFVGTDTVPSIDLAEEYYGADSDKELVGCSVPATEHSVMCMGTERGEIETFKRLINEVYPAGIVSIVSDTWDFWQVITEYSKELKDDILKRDGKVVFRPDSGDPVKIICGYKNVVEVDHLDGLSMFAAVEKYDAEAVKYDGKYYSTNDFGADGFNELSEAEIKGAVECLWDIFGGNVNDKNFKELDEHVGLIYGDSITPQRCQEILERLSDKGFASSNIVFGVGSYTYQYVTRDTYGLAVKATFGVVNGGDRAIHKNPKTDKGTKKSHYGLLQVVKGEDGLFVNQDVDWQDAQTGELEIVYENGVLVRNQTLEEIRKIVSSE